MTSFSSSYPKDSSLIRFMHQWMELPRLTLCRRNFKEMTYEYKMQLLLKLALKLSAKKHLSEAFEGSFQLKNLKTRPQKDFFGVPSPPLAKRFETVLRSRPVAAIIGGEPPRPLGRGYRSRWWLEMSFSREAASWSISVALPSAMTFRACCWR